MAIEVTLQLPESVYEQAQSAAADKAKPVEDVLVETLAATYQTEGSGQSSLATEIQAFLAQQGQLKRKYSDQYVAMSGGVVVDHDKDRFALSDRVYEQYPIQAVLIRHVDQSPEQVLYFRSPRLVSDT